MSKKNPIHGVSKQGVRHKVPMPADPQKVVRRRKKRNAIDFKDPDVMMHIDAVLRYTKRRGEQ